MRVAFTYLPIRLKEFTEIYLKYSIENLNAQLFGLQTGGNNDKLEHAKTMGINQVLDNQNAISKRYAPNSHFPSLHLQVDRLT